MSTEETAAGGPGGSRIRPPTAAGLIEAAWALARAVGRLSGAPGAITGAAVALGIALRLAEYTNARAVWMDESMLRENIAGVPVFAFGHPSPHGQLAPPGFLAVSRIFGRLAGDGVPTLRLLPLTCAIVALAVLAVLARRVVSARAAALAVGIVAVSDPLIYFATEFKQYSADLLIVEGCLLMGLWLGEAGLSARRLGAASLLGVAATWFSHPSIFVLAGVWAYLAWREAAAGRWDRLARLTAVGVAWAISFAGCFVVSRWQLAGSRFMWEWWGFAFLPLPPKSLADASRVFWQFANVTNYPVGIIAPRPIGPVGIALAAVGLLAIGGVAFAARGRWDVLLLLATPILLAMIASALERYPFHGRLLLYLVPSVVLLIAEGADAVGRRWGRWAFAAIVAVLVIPPTLAALSTVHMARTRDFDSHGDHKNDLLDYLEEQELPWPTSRPQPGRRAARSPDDEPPAARTTSRPQPGRRAARSPDDEPPAARTTSRPQPGRRAARSPDDEPPAARTTSRPQPGRRAARSPDDEPPAARTTSRPQP